MIPIEYIRSSSYNTHSMCPTKYFGEYVLGFTSPPGIKANKGTICHKVCEILAIWKLTHQNGESYFSDDEILGQCFINGLESITQDSTSKELDIDAILELVYEYYVERDKDNFWSPADYRECRLWTYKILQYNDGNFHAFNQNIVQPEQKFDIELKQDWAKYEDDGLEKYLKIKGTIDLITKVDDNTYEIIDWKTGKRINWATGEEKTYEYLCNKDFQLRLYHYAVSLLYPHIENILVTIVFINDGGAFTVAFGKSDLHDTAELIRKKFEEIKNTEKLETKYGLPCRFCDFSKKTFGEISDGQISDIKAQRKLKFTEAGENMKVCDCLKYINRFKSIKDMTENLSKEDHEIGFYSAPGAT